MAAVHKALTPPLYSLFLGTQTQEADAAAAGGGGKPKAQAARLKKELRTIPRLVFLVEEWERHLVALGKVRGVTAVTR